MQHANPILVEVTRGSAVESVHRGSAVVMDRRGRVLRFWGDMNAPVYPRSAVKPLQALPLLRTGAARALAVSPEEIATACASHGGEPVHTAIVGDWLQRLDCGPGHLECGAHPPTDRATRNALVRDGREPSALHNNCSGKHTGFLTVCRHLGLPLSGYTRADHGVQALVRDALSELTGSPLRDAPSGIDGCGIPVYGIPLRGLAAAMAKLASPGTLDDPTADALHVIRGAMTSHPYLVAGRNRFCTGIMEALAPNVLVKTGAEGTCCALVVDQGLGIALKIDDGASRAAETATAAILRHLGAIDETPAAELAGRLEPDVLNVSGHKVGAVSASPMRLQP